MNVVTLKIPPKINNVTNDWKVIDIAQQYPPRTWENVFRDAEEELKDISDLLEDDKKEHGRYYPDSRNLFKCFELTPLNKVKVVILGQDPFHSTNGDGTPQAQGLCFSVKRGAKIPSSLVNIYKELKTSVPGFVTPNHGCLESWALQGVLLLNTCLTVRPASPDCHKELFLGFIKKIINAILDANPGCIFVMWGRKAQKVQKMIGARATVLEAAHPSGLSASRGFFGCDHFNKINTLLTEKGDTPIDWNLP